MATSLAALAGRLEAKVPARGDVPGDYDQLVKEAVMQLGSDAPMMRSGSVSVVSGTASYALPADFLFLVEMFSLSSAGGVIIGDAGIIPVPSSFDEWYEIAGGEITFMPTPGYTLQRNFRYAAGYVLTGSAGAEVYANLSENGARIALLYAQYLALSEQATAVAGDGWRYQIGDEMVDKTKQGEGLRGQANAVLQNYQREAKSQSYGSRARYNGSGV